MRLPSYRRHSGGQARVTIAGKDYLLGKYGSKESKQKYHRLIAEFVASGQSPTFGVKPSEITVFELTAAYVKFAKQYYGTGPTSELLQSRVAIRTLKNLYGSEPAIEFGPLQFKAIRSHLQLPVVIKRKDGSKRKKLRSRRYLNATMKRVRRIFRWAASEGILPASIYEGLKCVDPLKAGRTSAPERNKVKPVEPETVDATLRHLPQVVADMVRFQQLTGCRPGELCKITPAMVERSGEVWEVHLDKHKTAWRGKQRIIFVGPKAQSILKPYLLRSADANCFSPREATKQRLSAKHDARVTPLSCGNRPGTNRKKNPERKPNDAYTTGSYARAIRYACKKAWPAPKGLDRDQARQWENDHCWAPNQLRHSLATLVRKSDGLEAASILLGHSQLGVTQVYAQADQQKAIEVVRRIG